MFELILERLPYRRRLTVGDEAQERSEEAQRPVRSDVARPSDPRAVPERCERHVRGDLDAASRRGRSQSVGSVVPRDRDDRLDRRTPAVNHRPETRLFAERSTRELLCVDHARVVRGPLVRDGVEDDVSRAPDVDGAMDAYHAEPSDPLTSMVSRGAGRAHDRTPRETRVVRTASVVAGGYRGRSPGKDVRVAAPRSRGSAVQWSCGPAPRGERAARPVPSRTGPAPLVVRSPDRTAQPGPIGRTHAHPSASLRRTSQDRRSSDQEGFQAGRGG